MRIRIARATLNGSAPVCVCAGGRAGDHSPMASRELAGAVVVITGASSGIGRAAARRFAAAGARVVVTARRTQALQDLVADLGPAAIAVPADVADAEAVARVAQRAAERF